MADPRPVGPNTVATQGATEGATTPQDRIAALAVAFDYEAPRVVSMPLDGTRRIFPVYMGNQ